MLYAVEVTEADPGHLLGLPIMVGDAPAWVDVARDLIRAYRGALGERYGQVGSDQLDRLDMALRAALDL